MVAPAIPERHHVCVVDAGLVASALALHERLSAVDGAHLHLFCADELSRAVLGELALSHASLVPIHAVAPNESHAPSATACVAWLSRRVNSDVELVADDLAARSVPSSCDHAAWQRAATMLRERFPYLPSPTSPEENPRTVQSPASDDTMPLRILSTSSPKTSSEVSDAGRPAAPSGAPSRATVLQALERAVMDAPLFAALAGADHALMRAFGPEGRAAARSVLVALVVDALEGKAVNAGRDASPAHTGHVAPSPMASEPVTASKEWNAPGAAVQQSDDGADISSERVQSLVRLIERAAAADDLDAADRYVLKLMNLRPSDPDVRLTAGHLAMRRGHLRTAEDHFVRASIYADGAPEEVKHDVATAFVGLARSWLASSEPSHAKLDLSRALRLDPRHAEALELAAELERPPAVGPDEVAARDAIFSQGESAAASGDWSRAGEIFAAIVAQHPTFVAARVGVASALVALGRVDEGLASLEEASRLDPKNVSLRVQLGALLLQNHRNREALALFEALAAESPASVEAHLGLAESHRLGGRPVDAIDVLDRAHRDFPSEPAFIAAIGTLAIELGDRGAAEMALSALQAMSPEHPRVSMLKAALHGDHAAAPL